MPKILSIAVFFLSVIVGITIAVSPIRAQQFTDPQCRALPGGGVTSSDNCDEFSGTFRVGDWIASGTCQRQGTCCASSSPASPPPVCVTSTCESRGGQCRISCLTDGTGPSTAGTCPSGETCCIRNTTPPARGKLDYKLLEEIPGSDGNDGNLYVYLGRLYTFTFWAVGIAAVFMLTVGGFLYATAAGNTSRAETAKTIITDSLLGILVAVFSWLFLYIINPDFVENLPLVGTVVTPRTPSGSSPGTITCGSPPTPLSACCPRGGRINCFDCQGCVAMPDSVPRNTCNLSTCFLNSALLSKIQSISGVTGWKVTESWPPTAYHVNPCHAQGTCADMNNSGGPTDPQTIKRYYDAFRAAGLNVLYENKTGCGPYTALDINCRSYQHQTNNSSFHVW